MGTLLTMSQKELHRIEEVKKLTEKRCTESQAAKQWGISQRQVMAHGAKGLLSKKRGKPGNHQFDPGKLRRFPANVFN